MGGYQSNGTFGRVQTMQCTRSDPSGTGIPSTEAKHSMSAAPSRAEMAAQAEREARAATNLGIALWGPAAWGAALGRAFNAPNDVVEKLGEASIGTFGAFGARGGSLPGRNAGVRSAGSTTQSPASAGSATGGSASGAKVAVARKIGVNYTDKQLQKKYKHAKDFGVNDNYTKANAEKYRDALDAHVNDPGTNTIAGTYNNAPATHYYNPSTGLNVVTDSSGNFVSGWKLSPQQAWHVENGGNLGGGH